MYAQVVLYAYEGGGEVHDRGPWSIHYGFAAAVSKTEPPLLFYTTTPAVLLGRSAITRW